MDLQKLSECTSWVKGQRRLTCGQRDVQYTVCPLQGRHKDNTTLV